MRGMKLLAAVCAFSMAGSVAMAQGGGGGGAGGPGGQGGGQRGGQGGQFGPQLSEAERTAAWELQVKAFAAGQNLDDETTTKLVTIYTERRAEHAAAMDELRETIREQMRQRMQEGGGAGGGGGGEGGGGEGGGAGGGGRGGGAGGFGGAGREMQAQLETVNQEHRDALTTSLDEVLDGEQLEKATNLLGTFDTRWDSITHTIAGFNLGDEQTMVALWPVETYVIAVRDARREAGDDFRAAQPKVQEARDALKKELEGILTTDQLAQLERVINPGRGQGGGGPGGPGGGGGTGGPGGPGGDGGGSPPRGGGGGGGRGGDGGGNP